jgi:ribosomal protein S18 acetylase RimI-like enzyme
MTQYMNTSPLPTEQGNFFIRSYAATDKEAVIALWRASQLVVPWNDPLRDIRRKLEADAEGFLVGQHGPHIVASVMAGYDGHRGWLNYLAVDPKLRGAGYGRRMVEAAEALLLTRGCPKVNLQVRAGNSTAADFYHHLGYKPDAALGLGKRLIADAPAADAVDTAEGLRLLHAPPEIDAYLELRERAGMSPRSAQAAALGLPRSLFAVTLYHDGRLIGMGRLVGDGGCNFQIVDVAVDPCAQRQGHGRRIMDALMDYLERHAPPRAHISLLADVPEFYEALGFRRTAPASEAMYWPRGQSMDIRSRP